MRLDHINIRTSRLEEMRRWYVYVLGLAEGWRPSFEFPGAWLYAGDDAIVHLVGVAEEPGSDPGDLKMEHFALRGDDLDALRGRLSANGDPVREFAVPGTTLLQLNIYDPDGNHIHVDFDIG
ncbi:VOC family protein [Rhodobacteraceae bacterium NNCM2]|nr:VOC family protein [Coraliihabitans acroporae]